MKLTVLLTVITVLQATAAGLAQTITLTAKNKPLAEVMEEVKKQSGYHFFIAGNQLANITVNTSIEDAELEEAMNVLTRNLGVEWIIRKRVIVLRKAAIRSKLVQPIVNLPIQQERVVTGKVTDEVGVPLEGVTVTAKGMAKMVVTDIAGEYRIELPHGADLLAFSMVGYESLEQTIGSRTSVDIVLQASLSDLDEVVVVGYGTQKKSDLTGAVSQVGGEVMAERNSTQLSQALQGTIPGLRISRSGSNPNTGATIRIRGITTIGTSDPLVIIDGVPGDINRVNAADVERVSVLKDAASASIYGSRAAAGVILVTTKRAAKGVVSVDYSYEYGFERPTAIPEEVDAQSYMRIYNERFWNDNDNAPANEHSFFDKDVVDNYLRLNSENPDRYPITNWFDVMLRTYAPRQSHNLNFTAGGEHIRTKASLDYAKVRGVNLGHDYDRITFRVNNDFTINSKLGGLIDINGIRTVNDMPRTMATPNTIAPGVIYAPVWSDGRIAEGLAGANPYAQITEGGFIKGTDNALSGRVGINFKPFEGFKLSGMFAPTLTFGAVKNFSKQIPYTAWDNPDRVAGYILGYAATNLMEDRTNAFTHITQLLANYETEIASHSLEAMLGYENYYTTNESLTASRENYQLSSFPYLNLGNANYQFNTGGASELAYRSWFGRLTYNFASKYLLQVNGRYDLSSRFAKEHRGVFFPSVSAGWVMSEEAFLADVPWLSHLKARVSWGVLGNERIGDNYPYQSTIGFASSTVYQGINPVSAQAAAVNRYAIPDISWETTESYDFGLDANFLNSRLSVVADYYRKTTRDMLLELEIPRYIGLENPNQNAGQMYTRGWEFETRWKDRVGELGYQVSFNITDSKSIMGDLKGTQFLGNQIITEGEEYNAWYGYRSDGLFQTEEEITNSVTINGNVRPGDIKLLDISGPDGVPDGQISPEYDRVVLGGSMARYLYGGNINLDYKGFDLSVFVQGVAKQNAQIPLGWVQPVTRIPKVTQDKYWSVYNTEAENNAALYPRISGFYQANNYASLVNFWLFNGAYFRLKNITMGYTVPQPWSAKIGAQRLRLYVTATDLFSISNYPSDRDPEGSTNFITSSYVFGLSVNF